jgi:hypothetical protein
MTRVEWSPAGDALLVVRDGDAHVCELDGRMRCELATGGKALDARWSGAHVMVIVRGPHWRLYEGDRVVEEQSLPAGPYAAWAHLARGGSFLAIDHVGVLVQTRSGKRLWRHDPLRDIHHFDRYKHRALARAIVTDDGARVVVVMRGGSGGEPARPGYDRRSQRAHSNLRQELDDARADFRDEGASYTVFDIATGEVVDRDWFANVEVLAVALAGARLAFAAPPPDGPIGVVELGSATPEALRRSITRGPLWIYPEYMTGADAVALDPHGVLVAFGSPGSVRVDDIEAGATHALPLDVDPIALAFSPDSRSLACLGSDGTIAVLPVP